MFYLISKKSRKVKEEAKSKNTLRRHLAKIKNSKKKYFISSSPDGKESQVEKIDIAGIIQMQKNINEQRRKAGLKIIVPIPTETEILKDRSKGFNISLLEQRSEELERLIDKYGIVMKQGGKLIVICNNRKELRKIRKRQKEYALARK